MSDSQQQERAVEKIKNALLLWLAVLTLLMTATVIAFQYSSTTDFASEPVTIETSGSG